MQSKAIPRAIPESQSMAKIFIQPAAGGAGARYRSFPFIKLAKNDRMYYFMREKVIVFNTNLKKVTVNGKKKNYFSSFCNIAQSLAFLSHHFVTQSHTRV